MEALATCRRDAALPATARRWIAVVGLLALASLAGRALALPPALVPVPIDPSTLEGDAERVVPLVQDATPEATTTELRRRRRVRRTTAPVMPVAAALAVALVLAAAARPSGRVRRTDAPTWRSVALLVPTGRAPPVPIG